MSHATPRHANGVEASSNAVNLGNRPPLTGFEVFDRAAHAPRSRSAVIVNVTDRGLRLSAAARRTLGSADVALLIDRDQAGRFAVAPATDVAAGPWATYRLSSIGQISCRNFILELGVSVGAYPARIDGHTVIVEPS